MRRKRKLRLSYTQQVVFQLAEKQSWKCCYCGCAMKPIPRRRTRRRDSATLEHIIPRAQGGRTEPRNLKAACDQCNNLRGTIDHGIFSLVMLDIRQIPEIITVWHTVPEDLFAFIRDEVLSRARLMEARAARSEFIAERESDMRERIVKRKEVLKASYC